MEQRVGLRFGQLEILEEVEDEANFVEGKADDINEVGDCQHDFEAEFATPQDAGDFAVAVVGTSLGPR